MEGVIWGSLLALLVKRRIGFSIQRLMGVDISSFMGREKIRRAGSIH